MVLSLADVQAALPVVRPVARHTPMKRSSTLGEMTGADFHLKLENFQVTGSFKVRGALNKIHRLDADERRRGVVAASAGNHAQGVAFAARKAGVACDIFMPEEATLAKVTATRGYGARVHLAGADYQEAYEHALRFQEKTSATYVHAFDDPHIMAGQGTLGLEILEDLPDVETVLVPVGGGGLISGVATALKGMRPDIEVIGVQAEGASTMAPSLQKGVAIRLDHADTMADGIAVRTPGTVTLPIIRERVDKIVTVGEPDIAAAILFLLERTKAVAEGAGAVTLAAAVTKKVDLAGRQACAIVSGGNIDMTLMSRIIRRGLVAEGRIAILSLTISDRPGSLAGLLNRIAFHKASVIDIRHDRHRVDISINRTNVEVHVETRGPAHIEELVNGLKAAGYDVQLEH
ncbi:MAG: threonine dehydratase [Thermoplasmata archaeon]|nr:threonine dehydratase [Thermoplasmata archaeon]